MTDTVTARRFEFHADSYAAEQRLVVSSAGRVAEGVEFGDGTTVVHWCEDPPSTTVWPSLAAAEKVTCRAGVHIVWIDAP